ncbi:CoA pyrophosphatase [Microvirga arsenatis]|uniref:CoA pyrophosphatase n=1 Tax=Microvirga arsenatis TaxID=2692265 RepID=A0ABW9Z2J1_9HYPH|nr:CoA pyrophosphatase [Microvirga arsenatis]NBJ13257.1 CoA pyrophosphatase [Microvirga arsenatis]NBJ26896.1 CoA pyrophosphatase [Microvirga arsenatis]
MRLAPHDAPDFLTLAAERLRREPPHPEEALANPRGDHSLDNVPLVHPLAPKPAAVLVPVVMREEPMLLLTERAAHLRQHSGQIAFPGGRVDPTDASVLDAACREAMEEIGLDSRFISPLGYLDAYLSGTNYLVMPVVARIPPSYTLNVNHDEVADTFEVPVSFLMDPARHELHSREWKGRVRRYYAMPYQGRYIWGVTAGIIRNLYERLYGS